MRHKENPIPDDHECTDRCPEERIGRPAEQVLNVTQGNTSTTCVCFHRLSKVFPMVIVNVGVLHCVFQMAVKQASKIREAFHPMEVVSRESLGNIADDILRAPRNHLQRSGPSDFSGMTPPFASSPRLLALCRAWYSGA